MVGTMAAHSAAHWALPQVEMWVARWVASKVAHWAEYLDFQTADEMVVWTDCTTADTTAVQMGS